MTSKYAHGRSSEVWGFQHVQPPLRPELKSSGFDQVVQVVIHGRAEKPIYFFINEGEVEVMDAEAI